MDFILGVVIVIILFILRRLERRIEIVEKDSIPLGIDNLNRSEKNNDI